MNDPMLAPQCSIYIDVPLFYVEANGVEIAAAEGPVICASFLYSKQSNKIEIGLT
jgi:hypothetical protein